MKRAAAFDAGLAAVMQHTGRLVAAKQAVRAVSNEAEGLLTETTKLAEIYKSSGKSRLPMWAAIVFSLLALGTLLLLGKVFLDDARVRAYESEQENKRNQEAILRLLNEMGNLADGDLTVQASVTEDVTGAIADSINFTIEELRTLVKGINSATDQVTKATQDAQAISHRLYEASQRQNREIQQASGSVLQMAQSINEVSQSAAQSARVAQQSLATAEKGAQSVQNQIAGMHEIRAQIQDTSKRIKRLGESSLEIGDIVELIADITEQTNILALNAAIQAASAGEAGRGFTVVAEEVQRLAERSAEATKQIDAIVKTIQADTQDAVAAMEKSTCRRRRGHQALRYRGRCARRDPPRVARVGGADWRHFSANADAVGLGCRSDAHDAGNPADHRGDDGGHEADQRFHRAADEARLRAAQFGGGLQGMTRRGSPSPDEPARAAVDPQPER